MKERSIGIKRISNNEVEFTISVKRSGEKLGSDLSKKLEELEKYPGLVCNIEYDESISMVNFSSKKERPWFIPKTIWNSFGDNIDYNANIVVEPLKEYDMHDKLVLNISNGYKRINLNKRQEKSVFKIAGMLMHDLIKIQIYKNE